MNIEDEREQTAKKRQGPKLVEREQQKLRLLFFRPLLFIARYGNDPNLAKYIYEHTGARSWQEYLDWATNER